jgi:hypothetical protein
MARRILTPEQQRAAWIKRLSDEVAAVLLEQDRGHEVIFERLQMVDVTSGMSQAAREMSIRNLLSGLATSAAARDYAYIATRALLIHAMARQIDFDNRHAPF